MLSSHLHATCRTPALKPGRVFWIILGANHIQFVKPLKSKLASTSFFLSYSRGFLTGGNPSSCRGRLKEERWVGAGSATGGIAGCRCRQGCANVVGNVAFFNYLFHLSSFVNIIWDFFVLKPIQRYNRLGYLFCFSSDRPRVILSERCWIQKHWNGGKYYGFL